MAKPRKNDLSYLFDSETERKNDMDKFEILDISRLHIEQLIVGECFVLKPVENIVNIWGIMV